jgi:hypothetical protein
MSIIFLPAFGTGNVSDVFFFVLQENKMRRRKGICFIYYYLPKETGSFQK